MAEIASHGNDRPWRIGDVRERGRKFAEPIVIRSRPRDADQENKRATTRSKKQM